MDNRQDIFDSVAAQIEPFNKKDIALTEATTFAGDLEWDSLTVMDFVAAIEDEFDIIITMNMQAEIETVGQLVDAVAKLKGLTSYVRRSCRAGIARRGRGSRSTVPSAGFFDKSLPRAWRLPRTNGSNRHEHD